MRDIYVTIYVTSAYSSATPLSDQDQNSNSGLYKLTSYQVLIQPNSYHNTECADNY